MLYDYFDKFCYICEMYNISDGTTLKLILNFFPFDNSVQIINTHTNKMILKRTQYPSLHLELLIVGNLITIFGKILLIVDCSEKTYRQLFKVTEKTFAMIKPTSPKNYGKIITYILKKGFRITRMKNGKLKKDLAMKLYKNVPGALMPMIVDYVTNGEVIGLELEGPNAIAYFRECLGATEPQHAAPGTLRSMFGENTLRNVAHGTATDELAKEATEDYFGMDEKNHPKTPFRATLKDCTCCIIKPHVLVDGNLGNVLESITDADKFIITAIAMFDISLLNAKEFYDIYKGVLPEYEKMALHLTEGNFVVLEIKINDPKLNVVCEFRKLCGPREPDKSRQLYPNSLRALYGKDLIHNAVHCTDLQEDGEVEVEYFFQILGSGY